MPTATRAYRDRVPNKPKTQHRSVRVDDADWADLGAAAERQGTDRAKVLNQFIAWYLRRPDAELPERPPASDKQD